MGQGIPYTLTIYATVAGIFFGLVLTEVCSFVYMLKWNGKDCVKLWLINDVLDFHKSLISFFAGFLKKVFNNNKNLFDTYPNI